MPDLITAVTFAAARTIMNEIHTAYLLIGGNIGDRQHYLSRAAQLIEEHAGDIIALSSVYETDAWGFTAQPAFLNQVLVLQTALSPLDLLQQVLQIELILGRVREQKMGPRTIDIDILLYEQTILDLPELVLPHPSLQFRRFALMPLAEVAPGLPHPVLQKTVAELLTDCPDKLAVKKIS